MDVSPSSEVAWPPSLRVYTRKCFRNCSTEDEGDVVALILKDKISEANIEGTLWSIDWDREPLLTLPVLTGAKKGEELCIGSTNTTVEQTQEADLSADLNLSDACDDASDEWRSDSEEETPSENIGDLSFLFGDTEGTSMYAFNSESVTGTATKTPSPKKRRSPASKMSQMNRLLQHQQKLVIQKGLPKSRLQNEFDVTPSSDTLQHVRSATKFRKNLLSNFQELEPNPEAPCPTSQSLKPAGGKCLVSKTESTKCIGDYHKVVSSGYKNSSSLSHSGYEPDEKDNLSSPISSVSLVQIADYPMSGKVHVPSVPELSIQSTDSPRNGNVHIPSVQNPDYKESEMHSSQGKNKNDIGISSGTIHKTQTLNAKSFQSEKENFQSSAQSSMQQEALLPQYWPQGGIYLSSGWYVNVGAAYCGGCQLYGTLLQKL